MGDYVDAEHLGPMILSSDIQVLSPRISQAAEDHLIKTFPLQTKSTTQFLNWDNLPSTVFDWMPATDEDTLVWASATIIGQCEFALLLFRSDQPCLVGKPEFMIRHLDELIWGAPGCRLLFGVERGADGDIRFTNGIIEFDGRSRLYASIST